MKVEKIKYKTPKGNILEEVYIEVLKGKFKRVYLSEEFYEINPKSIIARYELDIGLNGSFIKKE